jgi:hypothetical protein|tara:strand:+ start:1383 stop:1748 length:366 start_codon:yes stop_codon:yes gene_type:complete
MNNKMKRMGLYLVGCMGARSTLTYIVKNHPDKYKNILTAMLLIPAIGFAYIYLNGLRKTGGEVFGDKIWWNNLRPVHSILYLITAILVFLKNKKAFYVLAVDTLIGLVAFTLYHSGIIYNS